MSSAGLAEARAELEELAREVLHPSSPLLAGSGSGAAVDWSLIARLGWLGLDVTEHLNGAAATFEEVAVVLTAMGRDATAAPFLGSGALAIGALNLAQSSTRRDATLLQAVEGNIRATCVVPTDWDDHDHAEVGFSLQRVGDNWHLDGSASFVPDVLGADLLLLPAFQGHKVVLACVELPATGLSLAEQPVVDATRRLGSLTAMSVAVSQEDILEFQDHVREPLRALVDRGAIAVSCDSLGIAETMLQTTVAYAKARQQFGRPIGSFQAVKHACADMLVKTRVSRQLTRTAATAVSRGDEPAWVAVSMAKSYVCEAAVEVAGKALQLHGGIGYAWESGLPAYLKRAMLNRALYGSPSSHRRLLASRYAQ